MKRIAIFLLVYLASFVISAQDIVSPNGKIKVVVSFIGGKQTPTISFKALYKIEDRFVEVLPASKLGIDRSDGQFTSDLQFINESQPARVHDKYEMISGKRRFCENSGTEQVFHFQNAWHQPLDIVFRVYNDGIAFRYVFPDHSDSAKNITGESTTYVLPDGANRWMQPFEPAYENFYPLYKGGQGEQDQREWGYPVLYEVKDQPIWVLISEADIQEYNCAARLSNLNNTNQYKVTYPSRGKNAAHTGAMAMLPWSSQWHTLIIGDLSDIVESTLITDVSEPYVLKETNWIKPGAVSWIYWANNNGSADYKKVIEYVDGAVAMHWPYVLIDWQWDKMHNGGNIVDAVNYAKSKGVKPLLWYNSSTAGIDTSNNANGWFKNATPFNRLNTAEHRRQEFAWLQKIGVYGIKVDFFGGDGQNMMKYYIDILRDAARYHLMVNFHGATLPRGWARTYPNLMTTEAVYGAEWYNNTPTFTNKAAGHNTTLPFLRNVVGSMDYTPVTFSNSQHPHITSYAHELALAVVFESGLQHFADKPAAYRSLPDEEKAFLMDFPTAWDDTRLLDGYPGEKIVIARKKNNQWYIGGLNGKDTAQTLTARLAFLKEGKYELLLIKDGKDDSSFVCEKIKLTNTDTIKVDCPGRGGFAGVIKKVTESQTAQHFFPKERLITTGIYYYPEHWKEDQWERDIRKIADMGYEFVHLAEFAWYKLEPVEGKFDFAWLDKVVNLCQKYNLKVLMCTPSATMPAWMRDKYPETYLMYGNYIRGEHGTRGLGSIANSKYRFFVDRIVTELARHYGQNSNVIGWQLDNEPDAKTDYSPSSQIAFRQWLKKRYKIIDSLNGAWGNDFWSQRYDNFNQVIIPNTTLVNWWGNNPHALLDLKRYSADEQAGFLDFQANSLRKYISPNQYITTNYTAVCPYANPRATKKMDFATYTAYPNGGGSNMGDLGFRLGDAKLVLFASAYFKPVGGLTGVMEMQPGPTNWAGYASLLLPGTVRMWLYHSFAAGGEIACSYRFRQILYGSEQYHAAVIKTDGVTPSAGGEAYIQFNKEIRKLREYYQADAQMPEKLAARKTAIVWNLENYWSIDCQKQNVQWDAWNYPVKFVEMAKSFGAPVDVVDEKTDLSSYKVVIIPAYEMADPGLIKKWTDYVTNGGHLIVTCRTATKDHNGHFWEGETAAPLSDLIGAHIKATDMLSPNSKGDILSNQDHYSWNIWGDLLAPDDSAIVLATYNDQFYKGGAAVVRRNTGKGSVTYIGVVTRDMKLEKEMLKDNYLTAGASVENYPPGVYVYWRDGFYTAVNYSSDNYEMSIPSPAKILIGDKLLRPAGVLVWTE